MDEQSGFFGAFVNESEGGDTSQALMESSELLQQLLRENDHFTKKSPSIEREAPAHANSSSLDRSVERYRSFKRSRLEQYVEQLSSAQPLPKNPLHFFEEWPKTCSHALYPISEEKSFGGFYFGWNGSGIVVNPSATFLDAFHQRGHQIRQIHHVILTTDHEECYRSILEIHRLNALVNQISPQHHLITYHLNPQSHRKLSPRLKPYVKQERDAVRSLEFFEDSDQIEHIQLGNDLSLAYFPTKEGSLGLQFSLSAYRITYLTDLPYEASVVGQLPDTTVLILGLQKTSPEDLVKLQYNQDSLGYYGASTLIQTLKPQMALITEFPEDGGDIRLEICRQLREECPATEAIFPVDSTLSMDLETLSLRCNDTKRWIDPANCCVLKGAKPFSPLQYLSKESLL